MYPEFQLHPLVEYAAAALWAISGVIVGQKRGFELTGVYAIGGLTMALAGGIAVPASR